MKTIYKYLCKMGLISSAFVSSFIAMPVDGVSAQNIPSHYRGRACIILTNQYCEAKGWKVNDCANARFTPPNAFGNGDRTRLSLFWGTYAENFQTDSSSVGTTFIPVRFSWIGNSGGVADQSRSQWRIPLLQPANYSQPNIHSVIDISRYGDFGPGSGDESLCWARFRFVGVKYPLATSSGASAVNTQKLGNGSTAE